MKRVSATAMVGAAAVWIVAAYAYVVHSGPAVDFYPMWLAARSAAGGISPYGEAFAARLAGEWGAPFVSAGFAYPLPALLAVAPLAVLPFDAAAVIWTAAGMAGVWAAVAPGNQVAWDRSALAALLAAFMPFWQAVVLGQATLLVLAAFGLFAVAERRKMHALTGLAIMLMTLKPQAGIVLAAFALWSVRRTAAAHWAAAYCAAWWAAPFLFDPAWPVEWIRQMWAYRSVVSPVMLLPMGLLLPIALRSMRWPALAGALQVVLFPVSDVYGTLPLLLAWAEIGGWRAAVGAAASWLCVLVDPKFGVETLVILPLAIGSMAGAPGPARVMGGESKLQVE